MNAINLPAHFDGERIVLDEPFDLKPHTRLIVTVLPEDLSSQDDDEREAWFNWALEQFNRGYGDDEPDYPLSAIKEFNPDYRGR